MSGCNTTISHCLTHNKEIIPVIEETKPQKSDTERAAFLRKMQIPKNLSYLFSSSHFMHIWVNCKSMPMVWSQNNLFPLFLKGQEIWKNVNNLIIWNRSEDHEDLNHSSYTVFLQITTLHMYLAYAPHLLSHPEPCLDVCHLLQHVGHLQPVGKTEKKKGKSTYENCALPEDCTAPYALQRPSTKVKPFIIYWICFAFPTYLSAMVWLTKTFINS